MHREAAFINPLLNAARIKSRHAGIVGEPRLLNRLAQRVGDFDDETARVIVAVGVIVPINGEREAGDGVGVRIGKIVIIGIDESGRADGIQVNTRRGQLVGHATLIVIGIY